MNQDHLDILRKAQARVFGVTHFTVERATRESDGAGGQTTVWNTVASGHGTFKQIRAGRQDVSERVGNVISMSLVCAYDTDIRATDRVRTKNGSYDVASVDLDSDELLVRNVLLEVR